MSELQLIVDRLAKPPFEEKHSRVTFDAKKPYELTSTLNMVLGAIEGNTVDMRTEEPAQSAYRMINFLRLLNFKQYPDSEALSQAIIEGNKTVIYNILAWLLSRFEDLKMRAYVARFMAPIDVPQEVQQDRTVSELLRQYKELQEQFKEVHKEVVKVRASGFSPQDIKNEITAMEQDKEQLTIKIQRVKRKVANVANLDDQLETCRNLRKEQEQEAALAEQYKEQRNLLHHSEQRYQRVVDKLRENQQAAIVGDPQALVKRHVEAANMNRYVCTEQLPKLLEEKSARQHELQRVMDQPSLNEGQLAALQAECQQISNEIEAMTRKKMAERNPMDDGLMSYRQTVKSLAKKKETTAEKLNELTKEKQRLDQEVMQKEQALEEEGGTKMLQGEELKKFKVDVRNKTTQYRLHKQELDSLNIELGILKRTEAILKQRDHDVRDFLQKLEEKKGIKGYTDTQANLENTTVKKADYDKKKSETLQEISTMVKQIEIKIKQQSKELEPIVRKLRAARDKKREVEARWEEKKRGYDMVAAGIDANKAGLEGELSANRAEIATLQTTYHKLKAHQLALGTMQRRVLAEARASAGKGPVSTHFVTYKEALTKEIEEQKSLSKTLQKDKKRIKETHDPNMKQIALLNDLTKLLQCKIKTTKETVAERKNEGGAPVDLTNVGNRGGGGVDVMVVE